MGVGTANALTRIMNALPGVAEHPSGNDSNYRRLHIVGIVPDYQAKSARPAGQPEGSKT
jgi:hypothetical protein